MRSKQRKLLGALAIAALSAVALAAPASAYHGNGQALIVAADHDRGRTLSGQGAKLVAGPGASANEGKLTLPIHSLQPTATNPSASSTGNLTFRKGKRSVELSGLHFDLTAGTLVGNLDGTVMPVFRLGAPPQVNWYTGTIVLSDGALRFLPEAAKVIRSELELPRALRNNGVGMIWLSAQAFPTHAPARPVVSGSVSFGFAAGWRGYILGEQGPFSKGTITLAGGAAASGNLAEPASTIEFPVVSGSFHRGLFGAADRLTVATAGSVNFAKPLHCINQNQFSALHLSVNGSAATLNLNVDNDIDKPEGKTCGAMPPRSSVNVGFATITAPAPVEAPGGNALTWTGLPATLTAAGAAAWGNGYEAGKALDPVTITVGLG